MCSPSKYRLKPKSRIDKCIKRLIPKLNECKETRTLACCCGHSFYPMTIVCENTITGEVYELISGKKIPRRVKFYKRDRYGLYYIPEVCKPNA